jgi:hypothetical protein
MRCFVKLLKRVGKGLWDSENGFSADILFVLAVCLLLIAQKEYVMEAFIFKGMSYPGCNFEQYGSMPSTITSCCSPVSLSSNSARHGPERIKSNSILF